MDEPNRRRLNKPKSQQDDEYWQQQIPVWQQDDKHWQQEISDWLHQTQRLVALLYMLEKSLPEHSSQLDQHKSRIDRHNEELRRYSHGVSENGYPGAAAMELQQYQQLHEIMQMNHKDMRLEHERFSKEYRNKMRQFRELAERLIQELDEFG